MMIYMFHVPANAPVENMCAGRELEENVRTKGHSLG